MHLLFLTLQAAKYYANAVDAVFQVVDAPSSWQTILNEQEDAHGHVGSSFVEKVGQYRSAMGVLLTGRTAKLRNSLTSLLSCSHRLLIFSTVLQILVRIRSAASCISVCVAVCIVLIPAGIHRQHIPVPKCRQRQCCHASRCQSFRSCALSFQVLLFFSLRLMCVPCMRSLIHFAIDVPG